MTGPLPEAQLLEATLLNAVTYPAGGEGFGIASMMMDPLPEP